MKKTASIQKWKVRLITGAPYGLKNTVYNWSCNKIFLQMIDFFL